MAGGADCSAGGGAGSLGTGAAVSEGTARGGATVDGVCGAMPGAGVAAGSGAGALEGLGWDVRDGYRCERWRRGGSGGVDVARERIEKQRRADRECDEKDQDAGDHAGAATASPGGTRGRPAFPRRSGRGRLADGDRRRRRDPKRTRSGLRKGLVAWTDAVRAAL